MRYNKNNFFENTYAVFNKRKEPERKPDYISYKKEYKKFYNTLDCDKIIYKDGTEVIPSKELEYFAIENKFTQINYLEKDKKLYKIHYWNEDKECNELAFILVGIYITNEISSVYWYTPIGVYRKSNHWDTVATCYWYSPDDIEEKQLTAYCKWKNFSENEDIEEEDIEDY